LQCKRCGREISDNERYEYGGETLCEDCYINVRYPMKSCDPWAVCHEVERNPRTKGD
jgi:NMD protein affecting ribosome stability and mRNA decay